MDKLYSMLDASAPKEGVKPEVSEAAPRSRIKTLRLARRPASTELDAVQARVRPTPSPAPKPMRPVPDRSRFPLPDAGSQLADFPVVLPTAKRKRRSIGLWMSFFLMVVLPTLAASVYYTVFVSNQYVSEFRFAVRNQEYIPGGASSASAAMSASAGGIAMYTDNFLVIDYLTSRQAVEDLMKTIDLRTLYSGNEVDWLSRFKPEDTVESLVTYWQSMIDATFDLSTGLALVKVRAFTPEDSHRIAASLVSQSEKLINDIAARSRRDALKYAETDVARAEERLRGARAEMREFRDIQQTPDAARTAGGALDLAMKLRTELSTLQGQLATLRSYMDPNAPTVKVVENRIDATNKQIASVEREMGKGAMTAGLPGSGASSGPALSDMLSKYEDVDLSRQFAQKYYDTTLGALEVARSQAAAQQTYVATYVQPAVAQASEYPNRPVAILIILLSTCAGWFISVMVFYSIRDHIA